jgi:hypothetical protein
MSSWVRSVQRNAQTSTNNDEYNCTDSPSGERYCLLPFLAIGHPDRWSAFPDIVHKCVVFHFNIVSSAWLDKAEEFCGEYEALRP